jgi:hypothetical protein
MDSKMNMENLGEIFSIQETDRHPKSNKNHSILQRIDSHQNDKRNFNFFFTEI